MMMTSSRARPLLLPWTIALRVPSGSAERRKVHCAEVADGLFGRRSLASLPHSSWPTTSTSAAIRCVLRRDEARLQLACVMHVCALCVCARQSILSSFSWRAMDGLGEHGGLVEVDELLVANTFPTACCA